MKIVSIMRVRNEQELIADSLNHLLTFSDQVIVFDDASTDGTPRIIEKFHPLGVSLLQGLSWQNERTTEETRHRALLLSFARAVGFDWCVYVDCDERFDFDVRAELDAIPKNVKGVKFRLFDAYMTEDRQIDYTTGQIAILERQYGPEYREILMAWRNSSAIQFIGRDQREPTVGMFTRVMTTTAKVKHFGKSISRKRWDEKCLYYSENFPEPYKSKWGARLGRPIHNYSSFGRTLTDWSLLDLTEVFNITPRSNYKSVLRRIQVSLLGKLLERQSINMSRSLFKKQST